MDIEEFLDRLGGVESGGDADATNPYSGAWGTFQFMDWNGWARAAGLDPGDRSPENQRAVARFHAQQYYDQFGDWGAVAVAWYAGPDDAAIWLENPNQNRFNRPQANGHPSINNYVASVTGGAAPSGGQTSGDRSQVNENEVTGEPMRLPNGARIAIIDGKFPVVLVDVHGVQVQYTIENIYEFDLTGVETVNMTLAQLHALDVVDGGNASELAGLAESGTTVEEHVDFLLTSLGYTEEQMKDEGIVRLLARVVADPELLQSPTYLHNELTKTAWYQGSSDQALRWNGLQEGQRTAEIARYADEIGRLYEQYIGPLPGAALDINEIRWYATEVAQGKRGIGSVLYEYIRPLAEQNPESPWSRTQREEQEAQRQRPIDIENQRGMLENLAARWGVPMSASQLDRWANEIVTKVSSDADFETFLQRQAQILYPWKDPEDITEDAAQPWLATFERIMERPSAGIFDPVIQEALNSGTPLYQFEQTLREKPEWMETKNALDTMTDNISQVGRIMGFV